MGRWNHKGNKFIQRKTPREDKGRRRQEEFSMCDVDQITMKEERNMRKTE